MREISTRDVPIHEAVAQASVSGANVVIPPGRYVISTPVICPAGVTIRGHGLNVSILESHAEAAIVFEPPPGGYIWGGGANGFKIECNGGDGVILRSAAPSAVSQMSLSDLQIRNCRDGIVMEGTSSNEVYMNQVENVKIVGVTRAGVAIRSAAYNSLTHVEVTEVQDGAKSFDIQGAGSCLRHLTCDGVAYFDIPYGSLDQLTVEGIYAQAPGSDMCVDFNRMLSARNITLLDAGKCQYAIGLRSNGFVLDSVRVEGEQKHTYPIGLSTEAGGVVMNWTGTGVFTLEQYIPGPVLEATRFIGCRDITLQ